MIKLRSHGELVHSYVVSLLGFGWRDVADRLEDAAVIEPVDPFESGVFHGFEGFPWPAPVDHLGLEQAVDIYWRPEFAQCSRCRTLRALSCSDP